jgi:NAD(P)H dehydrogenase (quinone)
MKIGIIVHSQTGNTYAVALKVQEKLTAAGHSVDVERLKFTGGDQPGLKSVELENPPDASRYDALVFGAPVHAFSLSKGMDAYLSQIPSLQGKKIACFVTKGLRFNWTGGSQAISKMKKICESKGATVCAATGIVVWSQERDTQIADLAETVSRCF